MCFQCSQWLDKQQSSRESVNGETKAMVEGIPGSWWGGDSYCSRKLTCFLLSVDDGKGPCLRLFLSVSDWVSGLGTDWSKCAVAVFVSQWGRLWSSLTLERIEPPNIRPFSVICYSASERFLIFLKRFITQLVPNVHFWVCGFKGKWLVRLFIVILFLREACIEKEPFLSKTGTCEMY